MSYDIKGVTDGFSTMTFILKVDAMSADELKQMIVVLMALLKAKEPTIDELDQESRIQKRYSEVLGQAMGLTEEAKR
jgi:hypothetical protein